MKFSVNPIAGIFILLMLLVGSVACEDTLSNQMKANNLGEAQEEAQNARLMQECIDGGAAYNAIEKRCVCEAGKAWNGRACDTLNPNQAQNACLSQGGRWDVGKQVCQCLGDLVWADMECMEPEPAKQYHQCVSSNGAWVNRACVCPDGYHLSSKTSHKTGDGVTKEGHAEGRCIAKKVPLRTKLKQACRDAEGHWDSGEGYCFCTEDKTFINGQCLTKFEGITEEICQTAPSPGVWRENTCGCQDNDKQFSLARGGCVKPGKLSETYQRRICTSSINKGSWDALEKRCHCAAGEFYNQELCHIKHEASSKTVCESDFNQGSWNAAAKSCECPNQYLWYNQTCIAPHKISSKLACESEANGGKWLTDRNACDCGGKTWQAELKRCL